MKPNPFSPGRRQVILTGFASFAAPALLYAAPPGRDPGAQAAQAPRRLVLSGRVVCPNGEPLVGAGVEVWHAGEHAGGHRVSSDGDGRFLLIAGTRHPARLRYRVTHAGRSLEGPVAKLQQDDAGTWRATFGLTLA